MAKASFAAPRPVGVLWILAYPLYAVFAAMVFLSAQELAQPLVTQAPRPVAPDDPDWETKFPARVEALQKALSEMALPLSLSREREQGSGALRWTHRFYDLTVAEADRAEVEGKLAALQAVDGGVTLTAENVFGGTQVLMGIDGLLTHTLRLYWAEQTLQPRVSLLVAALGDDLRLAREVIDVDAPLALGIAPFRPFSAQVAELAHLFDRDVFLQWRGAREGGDLAAALATVPGAVGVAFDGAEEQSADLLAQVERKGLMHLRIGGLLERAGGADNIESFALSRGDPTKVRGDLIQQARRSGRALGVVEATAEKLDEVRGLITQWREEKLEIVPLARLASPPAPPPAP